MIWKQRGADIADQGRHQYKVFVRYARQKETEQHFNLSCPAYLGNSLSEK